MIPPATIAAPISGQWVPGNSAVVSWGTSLIVCTLLRRFRRPKISLPSMPAACGGIPIFSAILRISSFLSPFMACIMLIILPMSGIALLSPFFCLALMASMALLGMPIFSAIFHIASSFKPMYCLLFFFVLAHSQHTLG